MDNVQNTVPLSGRVIHCIQSILSKVQEIYPDTVEGVARRDPQPRSTSATLARGRAQVSEDGSFGPGRGNTRSQWHTRPLQSGRRPQGEIVRQSNYRKQKSLRMGNVLNNDSKV